MLHISYKNYGDSVMELSAQLYKLHALSVSKRRNAFFMLSNPASQEKNLLDCIVIWSMSMAVTRTLIGRGYIFIYSCSSQRVSIQIKFKLINLKRNLSGRT